MPSTLDTLDHGSLRRLFLDYFGRPPFADERSTWIGESRIKLIDSVLLTQEFWQSWLDEQLYYFLLIDNFRPTTESVRAIPAQLADGKIGVLEALHRICLSSSFDRRNPGPDTFVTVVMEQVLGLEVQKNARELEIGKKIYDGARGAFLGRSGSSQADVVHIAMEDRRALRHLLQREYERWMRQPAFEQDLSGWTEALERDPLAMRSVLCAWFRSKACDERLETRAPEPNRLFIRALYVDLLARLPDEGEAERLRSALDGLANSGPLRSLVARLILDSGKAPIPERESIPDAEAWIQGLFERLLGRSPLAKELATFVEAYADPACRPGTVLYAIVSHPEYQTW
jgi:hypothetical protein